MNMKLCQNEWNNAFNQMPQFLTSIFLCVYLYHCSATRLNDRICCACNCIHIFFNWREKKTPKPKSVCVQWTVYTHQMWYTWKYINRYSFCFAYTCYVLYMYRKIDRSAHIGQTKNINTNSECFEWPTYVDCRVHTSHHNTPHIAAWQKSNGTD